jgi:hypothetical protein
MRGVTNVDVRRWKAAAACMLACLAASPTALAQETRAACVDASERGQDARDARRLVEARSLFTTCANEACPQPVRKDCMQWLDDVNRRLPSVVISARDPEGHDVLDVRVFVDGQLFVARLDGRSVAIDPGEHLFRYEPLAGAPIEERVLIREGEPTRLMTVKVQAQGASPSATERPIPWPTFALGGLALLGAGSFAFFAGTAKSDLSDLRDTCGRTQTCAQSDVDGVDRNLVIANVSLGVGLVALAGAVWFYVQRPEAPRASARAAR